MNKMNIPFSIARVVSFTALVGIDILGATDIRPVHIYLPFCFEDSQGELLLLL